MTEMSRVEEIVLTALRIATRAGRDAYLDDACGDRPDLREQVERLLAARAGGGDVLEGGSATEAVDAADPDATTAGEEAATRTREPEGGPTRESSGPGSDPAPLIDGKYTLVEAIGEGGMGTVYLARQSEPVRRMVALKLIKAGMDSRAVLARFEQERHALALMDHPNIARVFDAGMTPTGRPFFVMELVDGLPLGRFCDEGRLTPRERLELFVPICQAVQHAHQKGVVHRDLKPANILVTLVDARPVPKIIDFGVAKAIAGKLADEAPPTQFGAIVGTLEYMSPEQAGQLGEDVDTRADVYSLGVILYELLTGLRPIDAARLRRAALTEMIRIVREEEPSKPSTRLSGEASLPSLAALRQVEPRKLMALLRGELDWVVMKCLEKQRDRRYATANALARDIQRYLADEAVEARPPSAGYRLRKFIRRNRATATAAAAVAAALVLAAGVSVRFGLSEARQRAEAVELRDLADARAAAEIKARARAEAVTSFVTKALASVDPLQEGRQDATIAQAMTRAIAEIESGAFADDPETEAALKNTIGLILKNEGKYAQAAPLLEQSLATREALFQRDHPDVADVLNSLAALHSAQGRYEQAEPLLERAVAIFEKTRGPEHRNTAAVLSALAALYYNQGRFDEAEPLFRRARAIREKVLGPDDRDLALTLNDLALLYSAQERYAEAEPLMKRALAINERALGPDHPDVAASLNSLALMYDTQARYAQAEPLYVRALAICEKALGPDHPLVAVGLLNLGDLYRNLAQYDRAGPMLARALAIREKVHGPEHADVGVVLVNLARVYRQQGRLAEAEPLLRRTLAIDEKLLGPEHPEVAGDLNSLGVLYEAQKAYDEAEEAYRRSLAIREKAQGPDHPEVAATLGNLASLYRVQGREAEAEPLARRAVEIGRKAPDPTHPGLAASLATLAGVQNALGKAVEARQGFDQALAILRGRSPDGSPQLARTLWRSAVARMKGGPPTELQAARRELEEAVAMAAAILPPEHPDLKQYADELARCKAALAEQGEPEGR
ncbi:serine/threonine-protein kinase [Paludisphaera soli]|uniref:serine/threonine-protein kinase n=1 Tax=Paludisphaera soli TaxID=2712865 RepID=UPI0013EBCFBE|nr:serine/threonine-protein kinase [Paludisphaera soli]